MISDAFDEPEIVVHQLLGTTPSFVSDLATSLGTKRCWFWLHDYLSICPSYTLQRNNLSYCGAPEISSNACQLCLFGEERASHQKQMAALFDTIDVNVISPSAVTAEIWSEKSGLTAASIQVCPHLTLDWLENETDNDTEDRPITIAYLGTPVPFKGWLVFEQLAHRLKNEADMRFVYFGAHPARLYNVDSVKVEVTAEDPNAMVEAVRNENVDLVLHWATWPETFSLSCFEAISAGAFVLTNPNSGNVAATIEDLETGAVLKDEDELFSFFDDERARRMVADLRERRRNKRITTSWSDITFSVLKQEHGQ